MQLFWLFYFELYVEDLQGTCFGSCGRPTDASTGEELKLLVGPVTRSQVKKPKVAVQTIVGHFIEDRLGGPDIKRWAG